MEKLPFVIITNRTPLFNIYLVNIKTGTIQMLVKVESQRPGFCLELEDGSFDYHFTHYHVDDKKIGQDEVNQQEAHHRVCIRNDLLDFLKKHD